MLVVMSNAESVRDAEFNEWYTHTHLTDILEVDGFAAAQRFKRSSHQVMDKGPRDLSLIVG